MNILGAVGELENIGTVRICHFIIGQGRFLGFRFGQRERFESNNCEFMVEFLYKNGRISLRFCSVSMAAYQKA